MQLVDLFASSLVGQADEVAIEFERANGRIATLRFGDLNARSNRLAHLLARRGLEPGDRLAVYLANRIEFVDVLLACLKLGVILVPINILYREREISHIVADARPRMVVTERAAFESFPRLDALDVGELTRDASRHAATDVRRAIEGDSPAALVYTSGTTGRSKGAILSHNNFLANTANLLASWRITSADRYLAVLPLFHVHGLGNGLMTWLASGCRMRLVERFDIRRAAELFAAFSPTLFFGVPTVWSLCGCRLASSMQLPPPSVRP